MKQAWLKVIDLETFGWERVELPVVARFTIGSGEADLIVRSPAVAPIECELVNDGKKWRARPRERSTVLVNRQPPTRRALKHGDAIWLHDFVVIFEDRAETSHPQLEAAIDEAPDEYSLVQVWSDWLLDRGESLADPLDGLEDAIAYGQLELTTWNGLIDRVTVRRGWESHLDDETVLARVFSLRSARWLTSLIIDLPALDDETPDAIVNHEAATLLRRLNESLELPWLKEICFGYGPQREPSPTLIRAFNRFADRHPQLKTTLDQLIHPVKRAWLTVEESPPGFYAPAIEGTRIPLDDGVWVGKSSPDALRVMTPAIMRGGNTDRMVISQGWWADLHMEATLNGRHTSRTKLLPGDVLATDGLRLRFEIE